MGSNRRLAVDKVMIAGLRALDAAGFEVHEGEEVMEHARVIKGHDDILAMRCGMYSCEMSVAAMEEAAAPGMTEDDIWAVLHAENIRRGGEWIETACWLPDRGRIHGFRNAARGWCRIMKFSPLIRTLSAFTAFAAIFRGHVPR